MFEWAERACPVCGSREAGRLFADSTIDLDRLDAFAFASRKLPEYMHPRLIDCGCGLLYANPALAPEALGALYQTASYDSGEEARCAAATYSRQLLRVLPKLPDRDHSLDIGAGDGAFLEELLRLGIRNACGVEPSDAPVAAAKPAIRPLIRPGLFRPEDFPPSSFSLVTCFQTLEHVWDPMEIGRGALSLLKPGGAFAIVVHNRRSLSARILGLKSPIFDIEHLQLFCPRTARLLLESCGFRHVAVHALWNRYPLRYWVRLLPVPAALKNGLRGASGGVPVSLPAGNLLCYGFR
jgi:SAM-dependent methyltransferase